MYIICVHLCMYMCLYVYVYAYVCMDLHVCVCMKLFKHCDYFSCKEEKSSDLKLILQWDCKSKAMLGPSGKQRKQTLFLQSDHAYS